MARATTSIRVGVGVVACDRTPPRDLAARVEALDIPRERFVLGIGSGFSRDPLGAARAAIEELRASVGEAVTICLAAMGPGMCRLAGEAADLVLLNWMTPERIVWARRRISEGARRRPAGPPPTEVAAYVRVGVGEGAEERLAEEAARYAALPHYARHFEAMAADPGSVGVGGAGGEVRDALAPYERVLDECVVRALPASDDHEAILAVARAAAPRAADQGGS